MCQSSNMFLKEDISNIIIMGDHMKIKSLKVQNIGGIKELDLTFNDKFNVICGANGIGKTTILNIIADHFSDNKSLLFRKSDSDSGEYILTYNLEGKSNQKYRATINNFLPQVASSTFTDADASKYLLRFDTIRNINYKKLSALTSDSRRQKYDNPKITGTGVDASELKNWFVNRFAFHDKDGSLTQVEIDNYNLAKTMFSVLDSSVKFKTVIGRSYDIMLSTDKGDIYFEYLSSGYKSCIYIIMGIMKEIEYRTPDNPMRVSDFDGCVLIDEIEEHLHPSWQARLVQALKEIFPKIQFIVTTHSPSVLQSLDKDEIIPLYLDESNETAIKELDLSEYGLQGWTLEEILKDVMGVPNTTSQLYQDTLKKFDKAMNDENGEEILKQYKILDKMLNPSNMLRKLLKIQIADWEE